MSERFDVAVVGGGFYGCCIALFLTLAGRQVVLLERERELLTKASYANQARVHYGYHYPRSLMTGISCVLNFPRFVKDFRPAVMGGFEKIYGIARLNSKVTANQFFGFCKRIGAPIREANKRARELFDSDLIEGAFEVKELAFDAAKLRQCLRRRLAELEVEVRFGSEVKAIRQAAGGGRVMLDLADGARTEAAEVFVCSYSQINSLLRASELPLLPLKHEIAEIALVQPPPSLSQMGLTVMDGPFFSTMPFPAEGLHSLSHVRYTPHEAWRDETDFRDPEAYLRGRSRSSNAELMQKDAARYLPVLREARYIRSLYATKTVLLQNESNDGRPILLRRDYGLRGLTVVMGGKIDNIYDIFKALGEMRDLADEVGLLGAG